MSNEACSQILDILNSEYAKDNQNILDRISTGQFKYASDGFTAQDELRVQHLESIMAIHRRFAVAHATA